MTPTTDLPYVYRALRLALWGGGGAGLVAMEGGEGRGGGWHPGHVRCCRWLAQLAGRWEVLMVCRAPPRPRR